MFQFYYLTIKKTLQNKIEVLVSVIMNMNIENSWNSKKVSTV